MSLAILREMLENQAKKKQPIGYLTVLGLYSRRINSEVTEKQLYDLLRDLGADCFEKAEPPLNVLVISEAKNKPAIPLIGFYIWLWNEFSIFVDKDNLSVKAKIKIYEIYSRQCFHYWEMRLRIEG